MKKVLITLVLALSILGLTNIASAYMLAPDSATLAVSGTMPSTTLVDSLTIPWSHNIVNGTLDTWVYRDNSDNRLIFAYQVSNASSSTGQLHRLTTTDFENWTTDVYYTPGAGLIAPFSFDRDSTGYTVGFQFQITDTTGTHGDHIAAGQTSNILWIKTNAYHYAAGETSIINGGAVNVRTFAPSATPEPSSLMLLGMGILGLFGLGKKRA